jgi:hypothetical protein
VAVEVVQVKDVLEEEVELVVEAVEELLEAAEVEEELEVVA